MAMTNPYASLSEVKAAARIADSIDDALLEITIEAASREIDAMTERFFYSSGTAVRTYIPTDLFLLETDDIISVSSIKSDTTGEGGFNQTWAASDYQLEPLNGIAGGIVTPFTRVRAVGDCCGLSMSHAISTRVRLPWRSLGCLVSRVSRLLSSRQRF